MSPDRPPVRGRAKPLTAVELLGHSLVEPDSTLAEEVADKRGQVACCPALCDCPAHPLLAMLERAELILRGER